jgi:hypothetical protein
VYNTFMDNTPTGVQPETSGELKPGDTIAPVSEVVAPSPTSIAPQPVAATPIPDVPAPLTPQALVQAAPAPPEPVAQAAPPAQVSEPTPTPQPEAPQPPAQAVFGQPAASAPTQPRPNDSGVISWTAAEFIAHDKSPRWYGALAGAFVLLAIIVFAITRDKISTGVVIVAGIALGAYGARQPQQQRYTLDEDGLTIGQKYLPFTAFRSFSVIDEGAVSSISFFPLKRFGQLTTIYYDPSDEPVIIDLLADVLPMDGRTHDAVDRFMKRIHF